MGAGDVFMAVARFHNAEVSKDLSMTFHGAQPSATAPNIDAIGDDIRDWWNVDPGADFAQKIFHRAAVTLEEVTLRKVHPLEPVEFSYTTGLPIAGTSTTDPMSAQTSVLISIRTANIGRSYRGRTFLPPITEEYESNSGLLDASAAGHIVRQYQDLLNNLAVDNFTPVVFSRKLGIATPITSVKVDQVIRQLRKRNQRAGDYVSP